MSNLYIWSGVVMRTQLMGEKCFLCPQAARYRISGWWNLLIKHVGCFSLSLCPNKFKSILVDLTQNKSAVGFSLCCNCLAFVTNLLVMETQFLEPSVTSFKSQQCWGEHWMVSPMGGTSGRTRLAFFTSQPTAELLRLQSLWLLFSIVCT